MIIDASKIVDARYGRKGSVAAAVSAALDSIEVGGMAKIDGCVNAFGDDVSWPHIRVIITANKIGKFKTRKSIDGSHYEIHRIA